MIVDSTLIFSSVWNFLQ